MKSELQSIKNKIENLIQEIEDLNENEIAELLEAQENLNIAATSIEVLMSKYT